MKPPYSISKKIVKLVAEISDKIGVIKTARLDLPSAELRKKNRVKTIRASLAIEGNTLDEAQVTAILENKRVLALEKDILEIKNAIAAYGRLRTFRPNYIADLLEAHKVLMWGLVDRPGEFRTQNVGILKGSQVKQVAPPGNSVKALMNALFSYLQHADELPLIKSCAFHYEIEFIHPFMDGNGRIGRFWQTLILTKAYPVFEFLPVENLIKQNESAYYQALEVCDKAGECTVFIEFMLEIILQALTDLSEVRPPALGPEERMARYKEKSGANFFTRKDYLNYFKDISAPTASRDLKAAVDQGVLEKHGQKNQSRYRFV